MLPSVPPSAVSKHTVCVFCSFFDVMFYATQSDANCTSKQCVPSHETGITRSVTSSTKVHCKTTKHRVVIHVSFILINSSLETHTNCVLKTVTIFPRLKTMAVSLLSLLHPSRYLLTLMLFSTLHCPSFSADLLDARLFSQTLSKLATDGLGVSALQVTNVIIS